MILLQKIKTFRINNFKDKLSQDATLILLVFIISLMGFFFGEKIAEIGIIGDETIYWTLARDFPGQVFIKGQHSFRLQRSLPSFLVYYGLVLFRQPHTDLNILKAFGVCSVILLTICAWFWCRLARVLQLSDTGKWLGFLALFINYPILKQAHYCPIATDYFAYCLALAIIYFYLKDNFVGLYVAALIAVFCWPTLPYFAVLLAVFPKERNSPKENKPARFFLNYIITLLVMGFLLYKVTFWYTGRRAIFSFMTNIFSTGTNRPIFSLLKLSMALSMVYIFFGLSILLNNQKIFQPKHILRNISYLKPLILICVLSGIKYFLYHVGTSRKAATNFNFLLKDTLGTSIMAPLLFLLSHIVFYGPFIILIVLFWKRMTRLMQQQGLGIVICMAICVVLSLHSESRRMINSYPFFVPFLIKALDYFQWPKGYLWFLGLLSLFMSKFWLTIYDRPWADSNLLFPQQNYFMHYGPWMNYSMYKIQGIVAICIFVVMFIMFKWDPFKLKKVRAL